MNFSTFFSEQARKPSGWFGRIVMPVVFDRGNAFLNCFVNTSIAVQSEGRVLEIGCGIGKLVKMMAKKVMELLEPGGKFVLAFEDIQQLRKRKLNTDIFQFYHTRDVQHLLTSCGFSKLNIESKSKRNLLFHCVVATK